MYHRNISFSGEVPENTKFAVNTGEEKVDAYMPQMSEVLAVREIIL